MLLAYIEDDVRGRKTKQNAEDSVKRILIQLELSENSANQVFRCHLSECWGATKLRFERVQIRGTE